MVCNLLAYGEGLSKWSLRSRGESLSKDNRIHAKQPNEWMVWHGRLNQRKIKGKTKNKGNGKQHGKKGKKGFHEMEEHEDKQETKTIQEYTEWTHTSWDHTDNWTDADWWSRNWSTDLWADLAWQQAARQVAIDAAGSRTVQFNAWRKRVNVRWIDDV